MATANTFDGHGDKVPWLQRHSFGDGARGLQQNEISRSTLFLKDVTPAEIIKKVRRLEIRTRHLVTDSVTGAYHSSFKGRGMDFEEVREYAIGDDVRSIDWNVSAKMDRSFVKVFREEREMTLMLLITMYQSGALAVSRKFWKNFLAGAASTLMLQMP